MAWYSKQPNQPTPEISFLDHCYLNISLLHPFLSQFLEHVEDVFSYLLAIHTGHLALRDKFSKGCCPEESCLGIYTNHSLQASKEVVHFATLSAFYQCHHCLLSLSASLCSIAASWVKIQRMLLVIPMLSGC